VDVGCSTTALEAAAALDTAEDDAETMISGIGPRDADEDDAKIGGKTNGGSSSSGS
jgi:hypothetical protein